MLTLAFNVKAARPAPPSARTISAATQSGMTPPEIDFSETDFVTLSGENLASPSNVKLVGYPNGYDHDPAETMVADELEVKSSGATEIVFECANTAIDPDGMWWGKPAKIIVDWADGSSASFNVTMHDWIS